MDFYPNRTPLQQRQILPSITPRTFEITLDIDKMKQNLWEYKTRAYFGQGGGIFKNHLSVEENEIVQMSCLLFFRKQCQKDWLGNEDVTAVWTLDLQNKLSHVSLNREIPGPEDRCTNRTDGDWQLKECRGWSKAYRDLSFLGFAYNLLQQKSSWGKEGISQKLSEVSREDGFLDKVVNKRNCLRLFVIIS